MSSPPISLESLARRQLMLDDTASVPPRYLVELQSFLRDFPDDTEFTIRGNNAYGVLYCREEGCGSLPVALSSLPGAFSGSIGSLSAYKYHIRNHPTHLANRVARVKRERMQSVGTSAPQRSGSGRLLAALDLDAIRSPRPQPTRPAPRPQPSRSSLPHKLPSGQVEYIELSDSDDSDSHKSKRPRIKSPVKQPLGVSNPNTPTTSAPAFALPHPSSPIRQSPVDTRMTSPPSSPIKAKENSQPTQPLLQQLQQGNAALQAKIREYQMQVLRYSRKGPEEFEKLSKYNQKLQSARTEAERVERQLNELSRPSTTAGPSTQPRAFQMPPVPVASWSPPPPFIPQTQGQPSRGSQMGDLITALAPGHESEGEWTSEDGLNGYGMDEIMPRPLMRPIPSRNVKATITDFHAFFENANQNWFGGDKTVKDALQGLGLEKVGDNLPNMETSLLTHQIIGVNWMKSREQEDAKFARGGILADAMGLGKTVQTIGIMCANPSDDPNCNATLIVAPLALLNQWKQEILDMTEEGTFKILIYHGPSRPKKVKDVKRYNVVLTTYHTLANEWPDELEEVKKKRKKTKESEFIDDTDDSMASKKKRKCGPLMDIEWYRVVLDEAQNIRNARTRTSTAVTQVVSNIRWCLTGTPLTNGLKDAFGLLRFIQHNPFGDWDRFKQIIKGPDDTAARRVQSAFAGVILRRNKNSELDGKKLIELPPRHEDWVVLEFTDEEREIYSFVEARSQAVFNKFLQAGTVLKNYSQVLVMLMRLRQICVHPCLLKMYESAYEVKDTRPEDAKKVLEDAARLVSNEYVVHVKKQLREAALDRMELEKEKGNAAVVEDNCSICLEPYGDSAVITAPCAHMFCKDCIVAHVNKPRGEEDAKFAAHERDCPLCRQTISTSKLFARKAFEPTDKELGVSSDLDAFNIDWEIDAKTGEGRYKARAIGKRKGRMSGRVDTGSDLENFIVDDDEPLDNRSYQSRPKRNSRGKSRNAIISDEEDEEDEQDNNDAYRSSDEDDDIEDIEIATKRLDFKNKTSAKRKGVIESESEGEKPSSRVTKHTKIDLINAPAMMSSFLPSTKMQYMMKKLLEVAESHPDDKTMVVSQWTSALDLCSDYLNENNIRHVSFKGSMSVRERNEAINKFMKKDKIKVMLMSLKAGGVGLNLTRGNRVMSLDLAWNAATDQQAFDRMHRLGQKKEVFIDRLVIGNTVEQRVQAIQERKQSLSDAALGEGTGKRMRLSVGELAHLFGLGGSD